MIKILKKNGEEQSFNGEKIKSNKSYQGYRDNKNKFSK